MAVSKRTLRSMQEGGWIRRMFEVGTELTQKHGAENVFDLSLGNPVMEPPKELVAEMRRIAGLRHAGTAPVHAQRGIRRDPGRGGAVVVGGDGLSLHCQRDSDDLRPAAGALNVIFESILNPDDEVVIFAPYFGEFTFLHRESPGASGGCADGRRVYSGPGDIGRAYHVQDPRGPHKRRRTTLRARCTRRAWYVSWGSCWDGRSASLARRYFC